MDDLLHKIVAESEATKLSPIVSQSHQAIEILCDKMSLMRHPMNEVRDKCFQVFYSCLTIGSKNSKLIQLTISGMQLLLRNQIYWTVECNSDEKQLPSQLIECISSTIEDKSESTQMEMLSILSEMSLTIPSLISLDNIEDIIEICCKLNFQSSKHQLAIEATASQSCHQFLKYCLNSESQTDSYVDEEIIPLLDLIINKLKFSQNPNNISVLLKCVHYFLITIPDEWPLINDIIVDIVWKTLIPTLIKHLSPIDMNEYSSKGNDSSSQLSDGKQLGRGSESLNKKQNIICYKKTIFKITSELLRLFGAISSLRPALESLFHRILLYPPVPQRLDALKWIQELFKNTSVVLIASVEPIECFGKSSRSKDLDLLHIILDSLEECSLSSDAQICLHSISAIVSFLRCLQTICSSNDIKTDIIDKINDLYPTLIDADFEGFDVRKTKYQSIDSKESIENQTKVSFETLKKRIVGFDNNEEPIESNEPPVEPLKHRTDDSFKRCFKNFKVEAYKSKLKELLGSKSMDSNNSQENEDNNQKPDNEENDSNEKQDSVHSNGVNDEVLKEVPKLGSRSTSYEEVEEYQKSIANSSFTEGPEYEDCVEQMHDKEDSEQISDDCPQTDTESIYFERNNARRFISSLKLFLPKLLALRTSVETDHALQTFASNYCTDLFERQKCNSDTNQSNESCLSHKTIINADGIYLSTYSTLLLNLKLIHSNFYNNSSAAIPLTEQEFIEELHSSGILVYISSYWLAELYQRVLSDNLLENAGYKPELSSNTALINLLTDIDGLDSFQAGAQQLSDYRRLEKASNHSLYLDITECSAAHKLVRRLLTAFWDTILGCLATVCNSNDLSNAIAINALLGNDSKILNYKKEMMTLSLDGLQMAAKLCIQLGLQSRCDTVFELLALSVIDTKSQLNTGTPNKTIKQIGRSVIEVIKSRQPFSLHTSHVLSLQVLLSCSLEIGSHCTACWRYVFKCCQYILELEHHYFTSRHSSLLSSTRSSIKSLIKSSDKQTSDFYSNLSTNIDSTSMPGINESEELSTQSCIEQLIAETNSHSSDSVLKDKQLERVIDILSHLVDLLFEDAANKLNLTSLHSFLTELCICSTEQLTLLNKLDENGCPLKSLLLFRLSDVMLRCAKSGRPLMHFMKCWSVVASHLVEAATHSDHSVAKKSISTLHDIINVILCSHNELPHFHFNEALFKPFENLMLLELCDTDIQELIISSICEFVEGTTEEIRSGWRSLFGALRGIRLPQMCRQSDNYSEIEAEKVRQLRVILDIFEAFLHTDNLQVFANAALDCMLCLIKLIKSQQNLTNQSNQDESIATESPDLCLISMKYLDQFSSMLRSMYEMPACPLFSSSKLLRTASPESKLIDTSDLADSQSLKTEVSLESLDRNVRILHVWFLLIEEFTQSIEKCEQKHRKTAIEILFNWLRNLFDVPGPNFAIYCVNHILLPSIQRMTRQTLDNSNISATIDQISVSTLRHLYGLTADLVVSGIQLLKSDSNGCDLTHPTFYGMELMLRQSLLVYIECLNGRYHESVAKLSCACIRHILLSVRTHFDQTLWQTTIECLWCAHKITLESLQVLVNVFTNKSQHFFDDFDQIQVISKRDSNEDSEQLSRLAQQIFLLDAQRNSADSGNKWSTSGDGSYNSLPIGDNRSFIFLINPSDSNPLTISYRVLIIQLTSHWLLLQTISTLVLMGIQPLLPNLNKLVDTSEPTSKPTILSLNSNQCKSLLSLLDQSYRVAFNFDSKLGLKFLIQKISRSEVPPNLYQFSSLIWSVRVVVTLFLINEQKLSNDYFTEDLKNSLKDLCERYSLVMKESDSEELTIDDICHQSLHFLQASNEELMAIIATKKLSKDIFATDPSLNEQNGDQINDQTLEEEEKYHASNCSDEERAQTPEEDIKIYSLATEEKLDSVVAEYKKFKTQLSPIPPNAGQQQKRSFNERPENSIERDSQKFTLKDSQAFTALWSEIIGYVIDLHLSVPSERFNQLVPIFLPSIQCLTINCNNKHLRSRLSVWITRIADNLVENNENKQ